MTLRYVFDRPEIVANCVAMLIPRCRSRGFGNCSAIGVIDEDGKLIGGIVYNHWDPDAGRVEIHGAAVHPRWLTRQTIFHMFNYPFHNSDVRWSIRRRRPRICDCCDNWRVTDTRSSRLRDGLAAIRMLCFAI